MPARTPVSRGEFELYVQSLADAQSSVQRLGSELIASRAEAAMSDNSPVVPPDYVIGRGDEILVSIWGSVDADLRLVVDRAGRITIPRVGAVQIAGTTIAELPEVVNRRIGQVFRGFQSSVTLGQLRGIQVFVTGFVHQPGTFTMNGLSTVLDALVRAGGPAASGSFRRVELKRPGQVVVAIDLYDLLLGGDRSGDRLLQPGDVVHVGPVGTQVGLVGSINRPSVVEMKPGETVADALRMAGGFSAVADRDRLAIERLAERNTGRVAELRLPRDAAATLGTGDVLRAFSAVTFQLPSQQQSKRVRVEGEVQRPAEYVLPRNSSLRDAIQAAGGFTNAAFVHATEFYRDSVLRTQQENYERALREMESELMRSSATQRVITGDDAAALAARQTSNARFLDRLRAVRPTGRVVLQTSSGGNDLPDIALEDGDRIVIPSRPTTVGVFGSVFNSASYLYYEGRSIGDYLKLAGGPTKGADETSMFVVRANGLVISARQRDAGWFGRRDEVVGLPAEPGDTVFIPEELDKTTFAQAAKDWTQILYQFGVGLAGIRAAAR